MEYNKIKIEIIKSHSVIKFINRKFIQMSWNIIIIIITIVIIIIIIIVIIIIIIIIVIS